LSIILNTSFVITLLEVNGIYSKSKKSQAALEYLVNYSWAFLIILGSIATLTYFGVFNPDRYIPDECDFGQQLKCVDHFIGKDSDDTSTIYLRFRNDFEQSIILVDIQGDRIDYLDGEKIIKVGEVKRFEIKVREDEELYFGNKEKFQFNVTFKRANDLKAKEHHLFGVMRSEVVDNSLGLIS
jgi:hypothetical protein